MILSRHLHDLIAFKTPQPAVLSVHLNLEDRRPADVALRAARKLWSEDKLTSIADDWAAVEQAVREHARMNERGLAIFSSKRFNLLRVCALPQPVRTKITLDAKPNLLPLLNQADQHLRYGVLIVRGAEASFYEYFMGRLRELPEQMLRAGESGSAAALMSAAATRADQLARQLGLQRLIVAARPNVERGLVDLLHRTLQDNIIVDNLLIDLPAEEIRSRIALAEDQARRVRETVLAHRLMDGGPGHSAVGLRATLQAAEHRRLKTLLVRDGFAKLGRRCLSCDRLSLNDPKCVMCTGATETVFNLAEELIERALDQGAEVFRLQHQTPLDNLGSIGAELRETPAPKAAGAAKSVSAATTAGVAVKA